MTKQVTQLKISWLYRRHRYFPSTILHASTHNKSSMPSLATLLVVTCAGPSGGDRGSEWIQNLNTNKTENFSNRWQPALPFQKEKSSFWKGWKNTFTLLILCSCSRRNRLWEKSLFKHLKHTKERSLFLHVLEINITNWPINHNKLANQLHWEKSTLPPGLTDVSGKL